MGDKVDALSFIVHKSFATNVGELIVDKLKKENHPSSNSLVPIHGCRRKVVAHADIRGLRKNVLAKCYGVGISNTT